jgi:hypothetical protein
MKALAQNAAALLVGAAAGVVTLLLVVLIFVLRSVGLKALLAVGEYRHWVVPPDAALWAVGTNASVYSLGSAIVAAPCWMVLQRLRLSSWFSAAALGLFLAEMCALTLLSEGIGFTGFAVIGVAGLISGLTAWATSRAFASKVS